MKPEHKKYIIENIREYSPREMAQKLNIRESKVRKFLERHKDKIQAGPPVENLTEKFFGHSIGQNQAIFFIILIIIMGFIVYANSLSGGFIWDDEQLVVENSYIRDGSHLSDIFTKSIGAGSEKECNYYRPLQQISYFLDFFLYQLNPFGYHLTNILLHIGVALGLFWLMRLFYFDNLLAALTALLFVVHPVHTEAVSYISGRADPLGTLFLLLAFIAYIKSLSTRNMLPRALAILSYALALLSRESSLILPFLLLLYHYCFRKKIESGFFATIAAMTFVYIFLRTTVLKFVSFENPVASTVFERIPGFFAAMAGYAKLLILPFGLHMEYGNGLFSPINPAVLIGVFLVVFLLIFFVRRKRGPDTIVFGTAWFFIALLPFSNIYPLNAYMAEHWLYISSMGFFLVLAKCFLLFANACERTRNFILGCLICLIAFYSYMAIRQNAYWNDPVNFYERTLTYAPHSARLYTNLGKEYEARGRKDEAIAMHKKAIALKADYAEAYNNLANVYTSIGRDAEAVDLFKKALSIDTKYADKY